MSTTTTTSLSASIAFTNIVQLSLVETTLSTNFRLIAEEIDRISGAATNNHTDLVLKISHLEQSLNRKIDALAAELEQERSKNKQMQETVADLGYLTQKQITNKKPFTESNTPKTLLNTPKIKHKQIREEVVEMPATSSDADILKRINQLQKIVMVDQSRIDDMENIIAKKLLPASDAQELPVVDEEKGGAHGGQEIMMDNIKLIDGNTGGGAIQQEMIVVKQKISAIQKQLNKLIKNSENANNSIAKNTSSLGKFFGNQINSSTPSSRASQRDVKESGNSQTQLKNQGQGSSGAENRLMGERELQELVQQINLKVGRLQLDSNRLSQETKTSKQSADKHQQELASMGEKIKALEALTNTQLMTLKTRYENLPKRYQRETFTMNNVKKDAAEQDLPGDKRIQEIVSEIQFLKQELSDISRDRELVRSALKKEGLLPQITGSGQKSVRLSKKPSEIGDIISSLRKDFNSLKLEVDVLKMQNQHLPDDSLTVKPYVGRASDSADNWKDLSGKLQRVRAELMTYIKEVESKLDEREEEAHMLRELEEKQFENRLLINKKADQIETEKSLKRLQTKVNNFIKQVFAQDDYNKNNDARAARQPWFCLSCDAELKNYTGKQGQYLAKDQLPPGKKLNTQHHMIRRSVKQFNRENSFA